MPGLPGHGPAPKRKGPPREGCLGPAASTRQQALPKYPEGRKGGGKLGKGSVHVLNSPVPLKIQPVNPFSSSTTEQPHRPQLAAHDKVALSFKARLESLRSDTNEPLE